MSDLWYYLQGLAPITIARRMEAQRRALEKQLQAEAAPAAVANG